MKLAKYKIIQDNQGKYCLMARERGLPLLELLITEPFEVPASVKALCFIPVFGFGIIISLICLIVYSREFWETIEKSDNVLDLTTKKAEHERELAKTFEEARENNSSWKEYMNL